MTRENKIVEKQDLIPQDVYTKKRKQIRQELLNFKKRVGHSHRKARLENTLSNIKIRTRLSCPV